MARHIRQKLGVSENIQNFVYTVVITNTWNGTLEDHPSIKDRPDIFEISEEDISSDTTVQYLKYI